MAVDYTDTSWSCHWSRVHDVGVVIDYVDLTKTMWALSENFESFSQILKEKSGKKIHLVVFTNPIAIILKYENPYLKKKLGVRVVRGHMIF